MASIRNHEDGSTKNATARKECKVFLDPETIKFGITCNLDSRNGTYRSDDGAFLYCFGFECEAEAVAIESHFRRAFKHATIGKTKEYVHVAKIAQRYLSSAGDGVRDGVRDGGGDHDAKSIARYMFAEVLAKIHDTYPKYRDNFGSIFYPFLEIRTIGVAPPRPTDDVIRSPYFMEVDEVFQETSRDLNTIEYTLTPQHFCITT